MHMGMSVGAFVLEMKEIHFSCNTEIELTTTEAVGHLMIVMVND